MVKKNILGQSIRELRKLKGITQKDLSVLTGFSQNTISQHENGTRTLDENAIYTYAKALGTTPQKLFDNISKEPKKNFEEDNTFKEIIKLLIQLDDKDLQEIKKTTQNKKNH